MIWSLIGSIGGKVLDIVDDVLAKRLPINLKDLIDEVRHSQPTALHKYPHGQFSLFSKL